ncbi:hypothetical protein JTE90_010489 [Oedothorax gibbosus]|uniref:Reverse transcriptase Ty1/copia-type domain-containing protein n=1 Tax=Oedothorax gibbosus TaxID=931172 RepID=A0AAV6W5H1_9ARAC|nr:hypothetical protein JTE90_010489 [Oedothorax gibbosus]
MKDLGQLHYCLGIELSQDEGKLKMSQAKYIDDLLREFNIQDAKTVTTPMDPNQKLATVKYSKNDAEISQLRHSLPILDRLTDVPLSSYQTRHHSQREFPRSIQQQS